MKRMGTQFIRTPVFNMHSTYPPRTVFFIPIAALTSLKPLSPRTASYNGVRQSLTYRSDNIRRTNDFHSQIRVSVVLNKFRDISQS